MSGPPGSGKSMLAQRLPSLLPPLSAAELLEVSMIHSVAGEIEGGTLTSQRPFRAPHHSASMAALVGGGLKVRPGEVSLAHHGVLFLDEMPEFQSQALDSLRQPMESGEAVIARANQRVAFPARFILVAAMNPCKCGHGADADYICKRNANEKCMADYQGRLSGPLLDRIDLTIQVPAVSAAELMLPPATETSKDVAARVAKARMLQEARFTRLGAPHIRLNAHAPAALLDDMAQLDAEGTQLLREAAEKFRLSARGYHRVLKVARTLADLENADHIRRHHLAEALSYRSALDRGPGMVA